MMKNLKGQRGFTLIEILVALLLVSIVLYIVTGGAINNRRNLEEVVNNLERSVRFSVDEAALKNTFMRIHLFLDKEPQSYTIEAGPSGGFTLKKDSASDYNDKETLKGKAGKTRRQKLDSQFSTIEEFEDDIKEIHDSVKLIGVASSLTDGLILDSDPSIYISPTGEKDSALIVIGTDEEVIGLKIDPFTLNMKREYHRFDETLDYEAMEEAHLEVAKEMFEKWLKED